MKNVDVALLLFIFIFIIIILLSFFVLVTCNLWFLLLSYGIEFMEEGILLLLLLICIYFLLLKLCIN